MFEIGWTELLLVGLIAVFVLKPKDYPEVMRSIGGFLAKARQMAGEFQAQFNDAMRDANLDDVRKTIEEIRDLKNMGPIAQVRDTFTQLADEATKVKQEVEQVTRDPALNPPSAPAPQRDSPAALADAATLPPADAPAPSALAPPQPLVPLPDMPSALPTDLAAAATQPSPAPAPGAANDPGKAA
jgi:sec-independent protein translocase protein TatB